jgi:nitrate/TMAO reductase-like tetraheme cytochrome c subunit
LLRRLGIAAVLLLVICGAGLGGAEYYTSRPVFCGTCHVMDPYFKSWSHDKHGAKLGVRCVDCHYAPGERFTIHAKFKGLSQVASYFSGRYGAARPRAHVNDASCLTSGCHGDGEFMKKIFTIGEYRKEKRFYGDEAIATEVERRPTVRFSHEKHLQIDHRLEDNRQEIEKVSNKLKTALPNGSFEKVRLASMSILPAAERNTAMKKLLRENGAGELEADAMELLRLEHASLRLKQLGGISCTGCHTYDATGSHHLTVERQACFTCHFTNQEFNHETGECLKCHEPPVRRIAVHTAPTSQNEHVVMMDHRDIVSRGIDCASCHRDVVSGDSAVTARECTHCHDQEHFLKDFESRTTKTVEEYHRVHVASMRARCADCHRSIEHRLVDATQVAGSEGLLKPVVNDCQHCHPGHHREQVMLLMGTGGAGVEHSMPNAMFGSRVNCQACHTKEAVDAKGDVLIKATEASCATCHGTDYEKLFKQWREEIKSYLAETDKSMQRVESRITELKAAGQPVEQRVLDAIAQAKQNIQLIRAGNGIHNKGYALQLLETSTRRLDEAMMMITVK